ncbi:pseudouridylate synthase [Dyadobacter psychrotolerans]|uniref:Pseudouridylate synthase n=1 Tax=Dyadobacter psychrotolerans TaxID=2541721 RepID=A0A4R5DV55_9BACT|nr:pseudouridylate synthase [Dyadobacter psychrotolerans]
MSPDQTKPVFSVFEESLTSYSFPDRFAFPFDYQPHPLSLLAVGKLQAHLSTQRNWQHNFGLSGDEKDVIGKMFGVLVVRTQEGEIGYLSGFSGKLAGGNQHDEFVPPIFDGTAQGSFLNEGMLELTRIGQEIRVLEEPCNTTDAEQILVLKNARKLYSVSLQNKIFDQYHFLNRAGTTKSLREIFEATSYKNPPAGAGECAAPKLLQYAFKHQMQPIAMAEFWWGLSPKSNFWKHGHFYPACREKCEPILAHMLSGIEMEKRPLEV